jgi:hypothetical protein
MNYSFVGLSFHRLTNAKPFLNHVRKRCKLNHTWIGFLLIATLIGAGAVV